MIYDTFLFFDELELLELRLHELDPVVDRFVIVESTITHSNKPKPLVFLENRERFRQFSQKIIHVVVSDGARGASGWAPSGKQRFAIEDHDRRAVGRGLTHCRPDDIILHGDVDELPRAEKVREVKERVFRKDVASRAWSALLRHPFVVRYFRNIFKKHHPLVTVFEHRLYYYYLNCSCLSMPWWPGTRMMFFRDFTSAYDLRRWKGRTLPDAGWHFSYMGGTERIRKKIAAYAHQEFNNPRFTDADHISRAISNQTDILGDGKRLGWVDVDKSYPRFIRENPERFKDWLGP